MSTVTTPPRGAALAATRQRLSRSLTAFFGASRRGASQRKLVRSLTMRPRATFSASPVSIAAVERAGRAEGEPAELQPRRGGRGALPDQVHGDLAHVRVVFAVEHFEAVDDRADRADDVVAHARAQKRGEIERGEIVKRLILWSMPVASAWRAALRATRSDDCHIRFALAAAIPSRSGSRGRLAGRVRSAHRSLRKDRLAAASTKARSISIASRATPRGLPGGGRAGRRAGGHGGLRLRRDRLDQVGRQPCHARRRTGGGDHLRSPRPRCCRRRPSSRRRRSRRATRSRSPNGSCWSIRSTGRRSSSPATASSRSMSR